MEAGSAITGDEDESGGRTLARPAAHPLSASRDDATNEQRRPGSISFTL